MGKTNLHLLLINPWIFDFAAHDLWAKPLGLLLLGGLLRTRGYEVRLVDCLDVREALFAANFKTLRLGLETADPVQQERLGDKARLDTFSWAMTNLTRAGFSPKEIGVYLLCGLPGQDHAEVAHSIRVVRDHGARPYLAEFSPIPGTALWAEAVRSSPFDLAAEPLCHNNSILPCRSQGFGLEELQWLKNLCKGRAPAVR